MATRPRGGASHPCPTCGSATRVKQTWREGADVVRERVCLSHPDDPEHRYVTREKFHRRRGDVVVVRGGPPRDRPREIAG